VEASEHNLSRKFFDTSILNAIKTMSLKVIATLRGGRVSRSAMLQLIQGNFLFGGTILDLIG
jgi:hypothetical protein